MGGSKSITVGYWYYMTLHMGLCAGPVDHMTRITAGGRTAWQGDVTQSGSVYIIAPDLWGGVEREGGLLGRLNINMGEADQGVDPMLAQLLPAPVPAFRGLMTLVYDGKVGAMNPYLKSWSIQLQKFVKGWRTPVWQPTLCQIDQGMNAAHLIYRAITDPVTGLGRDDSTLDLVRMQAAAQTLKTEGWGLCLRWSRSEVLSNLVGMLADHVGGMFIDDPKTGKQYLKLLRGDYDINTVPLVDESNIVKLESYEQPGLAGSVNEVTVTYRDCNTNKDAAITVQNMANVQAQGRVINQAKQYPGLWNADLAARAAERDLQLLSSLPARVKIKVKSSLDVRKGDVLAFSWDRLNLTRMPLRVLEIDRGSAWSRGISLTCAQDVFSLPTQSYVHEQPTRWVEPSIEPHPVAEQALVEASWRDLVRGLSAADLAQVDATSCFIGAVAARPALGVAYNYTLQTRPQGNNDWRTAGQGDFAPTGLLDAAMPISAAATVVTLTSPQDLDQVSVGDAAMIDAEILRVTALDLANASVTLARGCVDTVPAAHALGARVWFDDDATAADTTEYLPSETVQARLLTNAGGGQLDPIEATVAEITTSQRQDRPYPPGNLRINGEIYPALVIEPLTLDWSHRDRAQEADQLIDTASGNIGPETGVTYNVRIRIDGSLTVNQTGITGTTLSPALSAYGPMHIEIEAERGGLVSHMPLSAHLDFLSSLSVAPGDPVYIAADNGATLQLMADGGVEPWTWTVSGLPSGLSASAGGLITSDGTVIPGDVSIDVSVDDSAGSPTASQTIRLVIDPVSTLGTAIATATPVGFWPMNEPPATATMHDRGPNGLDATYQPRADTRGLQGGPFRRYIDGRTGGLLHIAIDDPAVRINGDLTVLVALETTDVANNDAGYLANCSARGDSPADNYLIGLRATATGMSVLQEFGSGTNALANFPNSAPPAGWHLYTYTRTGTENSLYIDATQAGSVSLHAASDGGGAQFEWGGVAYGAQECLTRYGGGALFNRVLSATELTDMAAAFANDMAPFFIASAPRLYLSVGATESVVLQATGGTPPYTWAADTLAPGLTLAADGTLSNDGSGAAGTTETRVVVTDAQNVQRQQQIRILLSVGQARKMWRIKITDTRGYANTTISEMTMASQIDGANLASGGKAYASSVYSDLYVPAYAFDADTGTRWVSRDDVITASLAYELPTPASVNAVRITSEVDTDAAKPNMFVTAIVQSSADSTDGVNGTWDDEWTIADQPQWGSLETREFSRPG